MVEIYSNSKLWLYENCPEAYKIKYIDRAWPEVPKSINAFLGTIVHEGLEWLHEQLKEGNKIELDELIKKFADTWHEQFDSEIRLNPRENPEDYLNKGVKFLIDYYQTNKPFTERTIEIEKKITFPLDENHLIIGYIDRIVLKDDREFEVHDYKTNDVLKSQKEIDTDRQLAFYHLGLQEIFGKGIKVKLIWHFLAHNKRIESIRTQEQLEKLKEKTIDLVKKIETTMVWPACGKPWCDWCAYKAKMKWQNNGNHKLNYFMK